MNPTIIAPIELTDIVLYGMDGKPSREYKKIILDGEAAKGADGGYLSLTQDKAIVHYKAQGKELPSLPLLCACLREMKRIEHPGLAGLVKDLTESWLATSTRIDYAKNEVIHGFGFDPYTFKILLPESGWMKESKYRPAVQALFGVKESETASVLAELERASGKSAYLWTPDAESRKNVPLRAAGLIYVIGVFLVGGDNDINYSGRSRGVRRE